MHPGIGPVVAHHALVMRQPARIQPVAHAQVGRQAWHYLQQQSLQSAQAHVQRRRGQHQALDRAHVQRHETCGHQPAQAVAEQNQRQRGSGLLRRQLAVQARGLNHVDQVFQQGGLMRQAAPQAG